MSPNESNVEEAFRDFLQLIGFVFYHQRLWCTPDGSANKQAIPAWLYQRRFAATTKMLLKADLYGN